MTTSGIREKVGRKATVAVTPRKDGGYQVRLLAVIYIVDVAFVRVP